MSAIPLLIHGSGRDSEGGKLALLVASPEIISHVRKSHRVIGQQIGSAPLAGRTQDTVRGPPVLLAPEEAALLLRLWPSINTDAAATKVITNQVGDDAMVVAETCDGCGGFELRWALDGEVESGGVKSVGDDNAAPLWTHLGRPIISKEEYTVQEHARIASERAELLRSKMAVVDAHMSAAAGAAGTATQKKKKKGAVLGGQATATEVTMDAAAERESFSHFAAEGHDASSPPHDTGGSCFGAVAATLNSSALRTDGSRPLDDASSVVAGHPLGQISVERTHPSFAAVADRESAVAKRQRLFEAKEREVVGLEECTVDVYTRWRAPVRELVSPEHVCAFISPTRDQQRKNAVYADLWRRGYFVTNGSKFGGDFLAYPGDPLQYHARYVVRVCDATAHVRPLTDLVGVGRVAVAVKKSCLLAVVEEKVDGRNDGSLKQGQFYVRYLCFDWQGVT